MTAKEYLGQAYQLDQRINSKLQQIESLRCLATKVTASYESEPVSRTRNVSSLEDAILRLSEAEDQLNGQIAELVRLKMDIGKTLEHVQHEKYRLVLEKRYLCYSTWAKIASDMSYSKRWVQNTHDRAVAVVEKLLSEQENEKVCTQMH